MFPQLWWRCEDLSGESDQYGQGQRAGIGPQCGSPAVQIEVEGGYGKLGHGPDQH